MHLLTLVLALLAWGLAPAAADDLPDLPDSILLTVPGGIAPDGGWPVFVLMHGYGVNKEDFADLLDVAASRGAAAIAIDAPADLGEGRRSWGRAADTAVTHEYLTAELAPLRDEPSLDFSVIHVGGFSQGGIQSLMLVVTYPELYGGALSISPAGRSLPDTWTPGKIAHPLCLISGESESEHILNTVSRAEALWTAAEQPLRAMSHPGGHHFPSNWVEVMGDAVEWILASAP